MVYLVLTSINGAVTFCNRIFQLHDFERAKQHVHMLQIRMPNYLNFSACKIEAFEQQQVANFDKLQNFSVYES